MSFTKAFRWVTGSLVKASRTVAKDPCWDSLSRPNERMASAMAGVVASRYAGGTSRDALNKSFGDNSARFDG